MDAPRPSLLPLLLTAALAWELGCTTGQAPLNCPETVGRLGASVLLPLSQGGGRSRNASVKVLVTMANSSGSSELRKLVSVLLPQGAAPGYLKGRHRLRLEPLSLEILRSRREDQGWYSVTLEGNVTVQQFCWQLRLYEQIAAVEIRVLNHTQGDGTGNCRVTLACLATRGDSVTYSWSPGNSSSTLDTANGSQLLQLVLGPQDTDQPYVCTASNPVSNRSQAFLPRTLCTRQPAPSWILSTTLVLAIVLGLGPMLATLALLLRRGKAKQHQPAEKAPSLTIYTQVQRTGSLCTAAATPAPPEDPCTTIYVAALAPASDSAQPPLDARPCRPGPSCVTVHASTPLPES